MQIKLSIDQATLDVNVDLPLGACRPTIDSFLNALPQGKPASTDSQARVDQAAGRMHDSNLKLADAIGRADVHGAEGDPNAPPPTWSATDEP